MNFLSHIDASHHYREDGCGDVDLDQVAQLYLVDAADALNMARLTLDGPEEETRDAKLRRATHARKFIVEAVTGLSHARLYITGIRTYALPVIMNSEPSPDQELSRLRQISSRLLTLNQYYLPEKKKSIPLTAEDEAQLALLFRDLKVHSHLDRTLRHKWLVGTAFCVIMIPLLGAPIALAAAAACMGMTTLQTLRSPEEDLL